MDYLKKFNVDFGYRLKKELKRAGADSKQLCIKCAVSPSLTRNYICGYQTPCLEKFLKMINFLDVSADSMLMNKDFVWNIKGLPEKTGNYILALYDVSDTAEPKYRYRAAKWDGNAFYGEDGKSIDFNLIGAWKRFEECENGRYRCEE